MNNHYITQSFSSWMVGRIYIMSLGLKGLTEPSVYHVHQCRPVLVLGTRIDGLHFLPFVHCSWELLLYQYLKVWPDRIWSERFSVSWYLYQMIIKQQQQQQQQQQLFQTIYQHNNWPPTMDKAIKITEYIIIIITDILTV